ncbi:MAG: Phytoene synthase [Bacteriovoracaceae bacterium]|nr:Phytoene synthase [Bacteriovoracaceae bacterium]
MRRQALTDFYAFCRLADDISDQEGLSIARRSELLDRLASWVKDGQKNGHPYWDRFLDEKRDLHISNSSLLGIIDGVRMDLTETLNIQTWNELNRYVYGVACCVGEAVLSILGADGPKAAPYSLPMGKCLQYLNIMRDLDEDAANQRTYVPEEFLSGRKMEMCKDEIREELFKRAMEFRNEAEPYSFKCLPAELMAAIYIEGAIKYWRFGNPKRLTSYEKLKRVLKTILTLKLS